LESFYSKAEHDKGYLLLGEEFRELLRSKYVPKLGPAMGEAYMNAVRRCLEGDFEGLWGLAPNEVGGPGYNLQLQRGLL
jgi:hypothetical protein